MADFPKLLATYRESRLLGSIQSILHWDMETMMPPEGITRRGEQTEYLSRLQHRTLSEPKFLDEVMALDELKATSERERAQVRVLKREVSLLTALSEDLVARVSKVSVASWEAWKKARSEKNFALSLPHLEELLRIQCELAEAYRKHPYLATDFHRKSDYEILFDTYEPGFSAERLYQLLTSLAAAVSERLPELEKKSGAAAKGIMCPIREQEKLCQQVASDLGLSPRRSRLDISTHPFSTNVYSDLRITTRYVESDLLTGLMSTIHETGHSLYEAGIPEELLLTPCGSAASLAVHESQSRFWENFVGRSEGFIRYLASTFSLNMADLRSGLRQVKRSFIRVDADEVSYHLHVYLRMELESAMIAGKLAPKDLPEAWNARFKELFHLSVPDDGVGCLQDVHWYSGSFGYFPTYSLGTLFAAELFQDLKRELPAWEDLAARGEFVEILSFLRGRVHHQGALRDSPGTMQKAIDRDVGVEALLCYFSERYSVSL